MKSLTNRNPTVYTGCKIIDRTGDSTDDSLASYITKFVSIQSVEERAGGGLILCLIGDNGKKYTFEFESREGGESARRQFFDDMDVGDFLNNVWDTDYNKSLVKKRIEVFVDRKKDYVVAVSPIFMTLQNKSKRKQRGVMELEKIFNKKTKELADIVSETNEKISEIDPADYENLIKILSQQKEYIQGSVRNAILLKKEYMKSARLIQLSNKAENQKTPGCYYNFIKNAAIVLNEINEKLETPYSISSGLYSGLEEIEDEDSSYEANNLSFGASDNDSLLKQGDRILEDILGPESSENENEIEEDFWNGISGGGG